MDYSWRMYVVNLPIKIPIFAVLAISMLYDSITLSHGLSLYWCNLVYLRLFCYEAPGRQAFNEHYTVGTWRLKCSSIGWNVLPSSGFYLASGSYNFSTMDRGQLCFAAAALYDIALHCCIRFFSFPNAFLCLGPSVMPCLRIHILVFKWSTWCDLQRKNYVIFS